MTKKKKQSTEAAVRETLDQATTSRVTVVAEFPDLASMLQFDALWVDYQWPDADHRQSLLTASEIANLSSFIDTGRRVVLIGENDNYRDWNEQILGIAGGSWGFANGCPSGSISGPITHELTAGVGVVDGSACGSAVGGTSLFASGNVFTLWGPSENVLTLLESQVATNGDPDNAQLFGNIADWTAASVPEPSTATLLSIGLLGLALGRKRQLLSNCCHPPSPDRCCGARARPIYLQRLGKPPGRLVSIDSSRIAREVSTEMAAIPGVADRTEFHDGGSMFGKNPYVPWIEARSDFESTWVESHVEYNDIDDAVLISRWKG